MIAFGTEWSAGLRRVDDGTLREWLSLAADAADAADTVTLRGFRHHGPPARKPDRTFVTESDQAAERAIRTLIRARHPDHGLVGEEYGTEEGRADVRWYIDPIDGTHNFIRGIPIFATLLAVEAEGEIQAGLISAPALGRRWWAGRGLGAWTRDADGERRIEVSAIAGLDEAQILSGSGRDVAASGLMPGFDRLLAAAWRERGFGDFWGYALLAEGAAESMIETGLKPWDTAPLGVLVEEAGGALTNLEGARDVASPTVVATNGLLHGEILRRLRG